MPIKKKALAKLRELPGHYLESAEKLEQLHFLAYGMRIYVQTTEHEAFGIDIPEHLASAEKLLALSC
jgi:3-deoxy-manno-octulosonate cytidylyltransferase (CMP-KDO synthetase)